MLRLSEMPDFLPLGEKGSPERRACALGTFDNPEANRDFMRMRIEDHRRILTERLAQASLTHLPIPSDDTKPITHSPPVRERVGNGE